MIAINLLPRFQFIPLRWIIFTIISFFMIIFLHEHCQSVLSKKQHKITLLKKEVQTMNAEILNAQHKPQPALLPDNPHNTHLLTLLKKLPHIMPVGLYLTDLSMSKNNLKFMGYAEKIELISRWITTLTAAHFAVSLQEITGNKSVDNFAVKFCLSVVGRA